MVVSHGRRRSEDRHLPPEDRQTHPILDGPGIVTFPVSIVDAVLLTDHYSRPHAIGGCP